MSHQPNNVGSLYLNFDSLQISKSLNSVGNRYQLEARFSLVEPLTIPKSLSQNPIILTKMLLLNSTCEIKFVKENGADKRFSLRTHDESLLDLNNITIFSILVDSQEIEDLNNWVNGESVYIYWLIKGYILPLESNHLLNPNMIYVSNWIDQLKPSLSYEQFVSIFINPLNLYSTYYSKFPIMVSETIDQFKDSGNELWNLVVDMRTLVKHLRSAVVILRTANRNLDYVEVMDNVKQSLDKIRKYHKDDNILMSFGDNLMIKSGTIYNTDLESGERTAALEHMKDFFCILERLYQISSKARHTTTRGDKNKGEKPKGFGMNPDRDEAILVTELGLSGAKYLISKLDRYLTRRNSSDQQRS